MYRMSYVSVNMYWDIELDIFSDVGLFVIKCVCQPFSLSKRSLASRVS